ncbi:MAG: DUF4199 domain-containing protein [Bacteroidales bacterium]|nr:DUF4199 domain-containing protein [Bacteroidales bacterium]MCF8402400.1 DUF4199 domain-containing protein [Bacteroidales bacterium]
MENKNYPAWKHALLYGAYIGIALIILSLIFYLLDLYTEKWISYLSYAVLLGGIILASVNYRNKYLDGYISYGQSVGVGFLSGFFAGILAAIFTYFFMSILGEDYIKILLEAAEENMLATRPDMSDEELDMALNMAKRMMKPAWMAILALLGNALFSIIFALIASIFIKKEENSAITPE